MRSSFHLVPARPASSFRAIDMVLAMRAEAKNRAAFSCVLALLMALACLAGPLAAAEKTARIQGTVKGADGSAAVNASVVIENATSHLTRSSHTDADGFFSFAGAKAGPYLLAIDFAGHAPLRRGFVLHDGMLAGVDLSIRLSSANSAANGTAVKVPGDFKLRALNPMELVTVRRTPEAARKASIQARAQVQGVNSPATFGVYSPVLSPSPIGFGFSESEGGGINENEWQGNGSNTATYDAIIAVAATAAGTDTTFIATDANNQVGTDLYQSVTTGYFNGATALTYRFTNNAWTLLRTDTIANYVSDPNSPGDATGSITYASSGPATQQGDVMWIYSTNTLGQIPLQDVYYRSSQYPTYCLDWGTVANDATGGCYPLNKNAAAPYEIVADVPGAGDIANYPSGQYTSASSLQLATTGSVTQGLQNYVGFFQCNSGDEQYVPGHTYEFGVWMKGTTSDGNVTAAYTQLPGTFYGNNGIGHTFTGVSNSWKYFTWDIPAPGCVPSGSPVVQLNVTFNGPGTVEFNGLHEFDTAYPPFQLIPQVQQAWSDYKPSTIRIWSGFSDTAGGYQFWSLDSWIQNEWQGRTSPQLGNYYTTDVIALRLPAALAAAKAAGANPWLIVSMDFSAQDWSNLVDYLAAPAGVGYAAKRPADHPGPYVGAGGDFPFIYLEVGNEEWGTQQTPLNFAYGQWVHYVASNSTSGKSYASQGALLGQFKFVTNGFFLLPNFGSAAIAQAPESTIVDYALYNSGDTSLTGPAYYQSDLVQLPVTNQGLIDAMVSQQKSDASNGHPYTLAAYESGPGADVPAHQGDPTLAAATATMDVDLYAQLRGFNPINFFLFGEGTGPYTSHTNIAGGFIPHPVWEASQMRNQYLHGDMVWTVPAAGNPTVVAPDNNQSYPAISTYAFHDANDQVDIAVLSRDFYNSTPVTINLPANATGAANIYSLTPSAGGDPSDTNNTSLLVPINSTTASASGNSFSFTIPPGSFYILQIPLSSAWSTNIPAPAAPTKLTANPGNTRVQLSWETVDGATSYNVLRGTKSGGESAAAIGTATGPSYTDTSVVNGTEYFYVVTAANVGGVSGPSNEVSATPNVADASIVSSQPPLDGSDTGAWLSAPSHPLVHDFNTFTPNTASYKALWDANYLYVLATVQDTTLVAPTESNVFAGDSVEVYFSGTDTQNTSYGPTDFQFAFPYGSGGAVPTESHHNAVSGVIEGQQAIAGGYQLAIAIPWTSLGTTPVAGKQYGFDVMVNDATSQGSRDGKLAWWGTVDNTYYNPSLMGPLVLTAAPALPATTTVLNISTPNGAVSGQPVTLTAQVEPVAGSTVPAGTVTFRLNGPSAVSSTIKLNASGAAQFTTVLGSAGSYSVTAAYNGSKSFGGSISAATPEVVAGAPTVTEVSVNPASGLTYGEPWTVTATVIDSAGNPVPQGKVQFSVGAKVVVGYLNAQGVATYKVPTLAPGSYNVQATFEGSAKLASSVSAPAAVTIVQSPTTTAVSIAPSATVASGQPITISATVAAPSGTGTPKGSVQITLAGPTTKVFPAALNSTGTATLTIAAPADGSYTVTAAYPGSGNYASSASQATPLLVSGSVPATATTLTQTASNGLVTGQPWTLTAHVTAKNTTVNNGTVTFVWTGGTATAPVDSNGVATYSTTVPAIGADKAYAKYSGSATFAASISPTIQFTVTGTPTTTTLTASPAGSLISGQAVTFTATVQTASGPAIPTGKVNFTFGSGSVSAPINSSGIATYQTTAPLPGSYTATATYGGSSSLAGSSATALNETVTAIPTTTTLTVNPSSGVVAGQAWTLTAVVAASSGTAIPSGNVTFNIGGTTVQVALNSSGAAVYSGTAPGVGTTALSAAYAGAGAFGASASGTTQEVISGAPTSTSLSIAPSQTLTSGQPYTLTATVAPASGTTVPTGNVIFTVGTVTQSVALSGGVAVYQGVAAGAGTYTASAAYAGSTVFASSTSTSASLTVLAAGTPIALSIPNYSFEQGGVGYNVPTNWSFASSGTSGNYGLQQIEGQASNPLAGGDGADYWTPSDFNSSTSNGSSTPYGTSTSTLTTSAPVGVFAANTQYSLTVAIADPADGMDISLKSIAIQLLANGVVVATYAPTNITPGAAFSDYTLNFYTSSHPGVVGQNITIALAYTYTGQYNRQAFYDNVRLTQTYGVSQPLVPTVTALSITPNSTTQVSGQAYTVTAAVSSSGNSDVPTGSILFTIGGSTQTVVLDGSGSATYSGTVPAPGSWSISAVYSGDGEFATSTSSTLSETVVAPGTAVPITIPNYSFEDNASYDVPHSWTFTSVPAYSTGTTYAQQYIASSGSSPAAEDGNNYWSPFAENGSTAPDYGNTTAILTNAAPLGTFAANSTYNLTVALASENDGDAQYKTIGFQLLANGVAVANFQSTTIPEGAPFADYSVSFDTAANPSVVGQNITVGLIFNYTGPYNRAGFFDNVRLTQATDTAH